MKKSIPQLIVKRLTDTAQLPTRATDGSAGLDLYADQSLMIHPHGRALISTGIKIAIPDGMVGLIWPRSGIAVKHGEDTGAGVIDADYRGEVKVLLFNHDSLSYLVVAGDRIAQLLIQPIVKVDVVEGEIDATERGEHGFGHSGS